MENRGFCREDEALVSTEKLYEGMFLMDSGQFAADPEGMSKVVADLLEKSGGTVLAQRPWQDGRLAYEIKGRWKGLHYLAYFRMDSSKLEGLNRACRLNDHILRHLVIQQPPVLFDAMLQALTGQVHPVDESQDEAEPHGVDADDEPDDEENDET